MKFNRGEYSFFSALLSVLMVFNILACNSDSSSLDNNENLDIIHVRLKKDPGKLNPILKASSVSKAVFQYIMPQVCDYNPYSLAAEPVLLVGLPVVSIIDTGKYQGYTNISMKIKPNARWDNGDPITVEDFIFTIKLAKHPLIKNTTWRVSLEMVKDVLKNKSDDKMINVIVDSDYYLSVDWVSSVQLFPRYAYDPDHVLDNISISTLNQGATIDAIVEQDTLLANYAKRFNSTKYFRDVVVGFGPYRLAEWETDQYVRLVKKDNYWAKDDISPYLQQGPDEIVFHIIPDEVNAISQIKAGQLDVLSPVSPNSYEQLLKDDVIKSKYNFNNPHSMKHYLLGLNNKSEHLRDINVRKALATSIDVETILRAVEYGRAHRITGDFSPTKSIYNTKLKNIEFDPQNAKLLLQKSGWTDTDFDGVVDKLINGKKHNLEIEYLCATVPKAIQIATMVKEQAAKSGIKIDITTKEYRDIYRKHLKTHQFEMIMLSVTQAVPPDDPYLRWHSDNLEVGESNFFQFDNHIADKLIEEIRVTKDSVRQKQLYDDFQQLMQDQQVIIPLYEVDALILINKKYKAQCFTKRPNYLVNTFKINQIRKK